MTKKHPQNGAVFRVHKNKKYTVMSNFHLADKKLSLKAKGLLSIMLSLPEDWNFSINGLATLSNDGRDSILSAMKLLQETGYLLLEKSRNENGQFDTVYNIYETPQEKPKETDFTESDFPNRENRIGFTESVNPIQYNTNKINTKIKNLKKIKNKKEKKPFGEFQNVFLTDEHIEKLKKIYKTDSDFEKAIGILSSYKESKKKEYKNDYAVLNEFNWVFEKVYGKNSSKPGFSLAKSSICTTKSNINIPNYAEVSKW